MSGTEDIAAFAREPMSAGGSLEPSRARCIPGDERARTWEGPKSNRFMPGSPTKSRRPSPASSMNATSVSLKERVAAPHGSHAIQIGIVQVECSVTQRRIVDNLNEMRR